jgi:hypothetical protein
MCDWIVFILTLPSSASEAAPAEETGAADPTPASGSAGIYVLTKPLGGLANVM